MAPFIKELILVQLNRLGYSPKSKDTIIDTLLRPLILSLAVKSNDSKFREYIVKNFKEDPTLSKISPDIRPVFYAQISKLNSPKDYQTLVSLHEKSNNPEVRNYLLGAITQFKDQKLIDKTITYLKSDKIRSQDIHYWISSLFMNKEARPKIWKWIKENWNHLQNITGDDLSFYRTPVYVARAYSDRNFKKEFIEFFNKVKSPAIERSIKQGIEILDWQSSWRETDLDQIDKYFK